MKKLHIHRDGAWLPVFCRANDRVITCAATPDKALPTRSFWAQSDLAHFERHFSEERFALRNPAKVVP